MKRKRWLFPAFTLLLLTTGFTAGAQQVDSIYFHLYTDSLKKGVYNYINVDARMSDNTWRPLSARDVQFASSYGKWDECNLIIDSAITDAYVDVTATYKKQPALTRSVRIYIKVLPDPPLKTEGELKQDWDTRKRKKKS
ncbi:hypothetical protein HNQ91_001527 [Filimonas zeae]|uniref:hypothetical protein n=1 Tax=Filimonas zeae TaxID=1737353 RepID=UPI001E4DD913|nr:hypothetical protein [Filimonas zeae]MDR6338476.1 hypothetical protein [Filimonas zeae]